MGVFPALFSPLVVDVAAIAAQMRPALEQWFSAHIQIIDPNDQTRTVHDPYADTGGVSVPTVLFDSGLRGALVQPVSDPQRTAFGGQQVDTQRVRLQVKGLLNLGVVRAGLQVVVLDGGNDSSLTGYLLEIGKGFDSSMAWDRIIECTVVSSGVALQPDPSGYGSAGYGSGNYGE